MEICSVNVAMVGIISPMIFRCCLCMDHAPDEALVPLGSHMSLLVSFMTCQSELRVPVWRSSSRVGALDSFLGLPAC